MVYDRELRGPAQLEKDGPFAERLTKERAEQVKQVLIGDLSSDSGKRTIGAV
jgi:hypothetical protein